MAFKHNIENGQIFNCSHNTSLTVIQFVRFRKSGKARIREFDCLCSCGNRLVVTDRGLLSGNNRCSCKSRIDLTGKQFGQLTILRQSGQVFKNRPHKRHKGERADLPFVTWLAKCSCGNEKDYTTKQLNAGVMSCGCIKPKFLVDSNKDKTMLESIKDKLKTAKSRAIKSGREFNINADYILSLLDTQQNKCYFSGVEISPVNISFDRIDNDKGYIIGNIHIVDKIVNIMKNVLAADRFISICKLVTNHKAI